AERRRHADGNGVNIAKGAIVAGSMQLTLLNTALDIGCLNIFDIRMARINGLNLALIKVNTCYFESGFCKLGSKWQTHISKSNNGDVGRPVSNFLGKQPGVIGFFRHSEYSSCIMAIRL